MPEEHFECMYWLIYIMSCGGTRLIFDEIRFLLMFTIYLSLILLSLVDIVDMGF